MITRDALYDFIQTVIDAADIDDALHGAEVFRNVRTSVDEHEKVVRVECFDGLHNISPQTLNKEMAVRATIQCWVRPDNSQAVDEQAAVDDATDVSFDMSEAIFTAIAGNTSLNGAVCVADFQEFETGEANLGTIRRGVTYLDGTVNPLGEG